ncbi:MAG TPA: hypothetical protein VMM38_01370 [Aridibacter sp.]|nr:hypothetical protein [Aridibacter sp.]
MASQRQTDEELIARMNAVVDHCSEELLSSPAGFDPLLAPLSWWRANWKDWKVRKLFIEYFIRIRSKHSENRIIPFRLNDVQLDLLENMRGRDVILKARQQGISTLILALKLAAAILFAGRNIRFVPHDPEAEDEFWSRLDTMYKHLPSRLRPTARYYSKELMQFEDAAKDVVDSRLTSLNPQPGQEHKLRSQTLTDAHLSEIPFWRGDQEKVFTALLAAAEKGNITMESTAGGKEKFHFYYQQGKKRKGGWCSHFYQWWWLRENRIEGARFARVEGGFVLLGPEQSILDIWNPDAATDQEKVDNRLRLEEARVSEAEQEVCGKILAHLVRFGYADKGAAWQSWEVAEYLAWRRLKIEEFGGVDKDRGLKTFLIEHPEDDEACFDSSALTIISPAYLKVTCDPQPEPIPGREYLIGADTSLGQEASDPSAIEIIELSSGRQAHSEELRISPDLLAYRLVELSDLYNGALIAVERNNTGIATIRKLEELIEPERIYKELTVAQRRAVEDGRKTYDEALLAAEAGIATTKSNKPLFAIYLERAVRTGELGLSNQEWCDQAQNVIWTSNKEWGARTGFHDDRVMALAIANYVRVSRGEYVGFVGVMPESGYAR